LPKGAQLINFARGDIVDTQALSTRLLSGQIKHAVLDVFAQEPLPSNDPLWTHPSLTILPHISAPTNHETAAAIVTEHLQNWFDHGAMPTPVSRRNGY
jgi:glyoxylate/hydroxypyruvate reductase A